MMVAIYARQSIDKKDSISIDTQIEACRGELLPGEVFKAYSDPGYSGKNTNRPQFQRMITDIENGKISRVIVYKLDRISRSILDFSKMMEDFSKYKVEFISKNEKFDTTTSMGKAMLNIIMIFAQLERETTQMRIKDNYYARGRKGLFLGGPAPFGFQQTDTKMGGKKTYTYKENPNEIDTLIRIFNDYYDGNCSLGKLSLRLNKEQIPAPRGGNWDSCKLSRILHNPVYVKADADIYLYYKKRGCIISNDIDDFVGVKGCYLYGKRTSNERKYTNIKDHTLSIGLHNGVINSNVFLACLEKMAENKQIKNSGKGEYSWITGIIKCGKCGYAMRASKGSQGVYYFTCSGKYNLHICEGNHVVYRVQDIEEYIRQQIFKMAQKKSEIVYIKKAVTDREENEYKLKITKTNEKIDNLLRLVENGLDKNYAVIHKRIDMLVKEREFIEKEYQDRKAQVPKAIETKQMIDMLSEWDVMNIEQKRRMARFFIIKILLDEEKIFIRWTQNFND